MANQIESDELGISWLKKLLIIFGMGFLLVGIIRQWPITGKTYMEFIQGDGYLSLMVGLIMFILGISLRLLFEQEKK